MEIKANDRVKYMYDPFNEYFPEKYIKYENKIATILSVIGDNEWFDVYFDDESLNTSPYHTASVGFLPSQLEKI